VVITRRRFLGLSIGAATAALLRGDEPRLKFKAGRDFTAWQTELRAQLAGILALPVRHGGPLDAVVESETDHDGYRMQRVRFTAEPGEVVPGYLLRPKSTSVPLPVMICLQGHTPGMHISIGQAKNEREKDALAGGRDLALQAVARGWAALVIEQRAFGERAERNVSCNDAALRAMHRGRPLTGQRVFDVMRAIDFAATQPGLDLKRLGCMGNSTGGTVSFYAACIDPRIALAVVSCAFCTFEDSWLSLPHCACGYLPGIMQTADMPDLAGLIVPRRLLIVAGRKDPLARIEGVEKGVRRAQDIFAAGGATGRVRLVIGEGGHQFYPELAWPVVAEMIKTE
jgi:dienelactone hydrolase